MKKNVLRRVDGCSKRAKEINVKIDLVFDINMQLKVLDDYYTWLFNKELNAQDASVYQKYRNLLIERAKKRPS